MTTIADTLLDRIRNRSEFMGDLECIIAEGVEAKHGMTVNDAQAALSALRKMQQRDETILAEIEV